MTQIAPRAEVMPPAVVDQAGSLMAVIAKAASDPTTDVDKLERLLAMYERITAKNAEAAFSAAFAEMQPELPIIERKGKADRFKFAKWEDVVEQITPVLARHGFSLSFKTSFANDRITVTAILRHREGHQEATDSPPLAADTSGSKNGAQALASSMSYGKRHAGFAVLNIVACDEDDDGAKAGGGSTITEEQFAQLRELIAASDADEKRFLRHFKIEHLPDLPQSRLGEANTMLRAKIKAKSNG